jgi:hypothetical protein
MSRRESHSNSSSGEIDIFVGRKMPTQNFDSTSNHGMPDTHETLKEGRFTEPLGSNGAKITLFYKAGVPILSHVEVVWPDGTKYEGSVINKSLCGMGTCTYANGEVYEGEWTGN